MHILLIPDVSRVSSEQCRRTNCSLVNRYVADVKELALPMEQIEAPSVPY